MFFYFCFRQTMQRRRALMQPLGFYAEELQDQHDEDFHKFLFSFT